MDAAFVGCREKKGRKMANVTLKIDDELQAKARLPASRRKTSINAIFREKLEEFVATDLRGEATLRNLDELYTGSRARVGKKTWSRDDTMKLLSVKTCFILPENVCCEGIVLAYRDDLC